MLAIGPARHGPSMNSSFRARHGPSTRRPDSVPCRAGPAHMPRSGNKPGTQHFVPGTARADGFRARRPDRPVSGRFGFFSPVSAEFPVYSKMTEKTPKKNEK